MSEQQIDFKVVMLGNASVGKTCLLVRFLHNSFGSTTSTIGASFAVKNMEKEGSTYTLGLWDTAGLERYNSLSAFYCRNAGCAIVCYDICDRSSFEGVEKWVSTLRSSSPDPNCITVIVGNKQDLAEEGERAVSQDEGEKLKERLKAHAFIETSSKTGYQVEEVFDTIATYVHTSGASQDSNGSSISSRRRNNNSGGSCC
eukprot:gb/GECH01012504.1/.p1 GENE.gb/GECH01012504.1/~~gb/GECH01012504.1/.p1  ORF type:complete len:200 (+),score=51.45 gb/GECH01012504.1/:1-600(+)